MTSDFKAGNYRFIPAVFQYSGGAAALPGYEIERVRFDKWVPLLKNRTPVVAAALQNTAGIVGAAMAATRDVTH